MPRLLASFSIPARGNSVHTLGADVYAGTMDKDDLVEKFSTALNRDLDNLGQKATISSRRVERISSSMGMPVQANLYGPAYTITFNIQGLESLDTQKFKNYQKLIAALSGNTSFSREMDF